MVQQAHRPPTFSHSASHWTLGSVEHSRPKLLGVTVKSVITLHPGSLSQRPTELESQQKAGSYKATAYVL